MNDIAKKATADKFLRALEKEGLIKSEAGACIGLTAPQVSYLFNEKYWDKLGNLYWEKILAWVNSGQGLVEYSEKHGKVLPPEKKKVIDPVAEALWQISVDNVTKKADTVPEKKETVSEPIKKVQPRLSNGQMIDMLLEEKKELSAKIEAIDVLLKHYIS